jgi:type IV pilus assembly protein PilQ
VFRLFHEISGLNFVLDPGVGGNVTIVLDEVPWDQALDLILKNNGLDKVYEDNVIRIASTSKLATEASGRKALKEAKELELEPVTITRRLSYAKAKDVDSVIKAGVLLSARGKSFFDDRTNTLIVTDVPTKVVPLDHLITDLDSRTPQVMIEARIVLTGRDFIQTLGINWGVLLNQTDTGTTSRTTVRAASGSTASGTRSSARSIAAPARSTSSAAPGTFRLNILLDALETEGTTRTLSAPKIATQNNVKAEIEQGVQIPIQIATAVANNVQFVSASLRLSVTPQITAEGTVIMDITVENNSPSSTIVVQQIPGIDTQRATTKVMVEDGGTTVIGGIFQVKDSNTEEGWPWLRKIPVFGWLFKTRTVTTQNRELLIFITPKILGEG